MTELMINSSFDLMTVTPDKVQALTEELLKMPQVDIPTEHIFEEGKYLRRITVPPHTVLTGAEHRNPYRVRLEKGTIVVTTEEGVKILTAPLEFDAPAGIQRAGHVLDEEVVWTDIYDNPDNCQNIEELENRYYVVPDIGLMDTRTDAQKLILHEKFPDNPSYKLITQEGDQ